MDHQYHYNLLVSKAKNQLLEGYTEKHHIIPICMNGSDDVENIVILTAREHFIAHLLLAKIHGGKLWHAVHMMSNMKRYTSRTYKWVKENHALEISKKLTGRIQSKETRQKRSRSMKGKIFTEEHKENISKSHKGKPSSRGMLGRKHLEITKQKQSESMKRKIPWNKGKSMSEEHKQKISEKLKGRPKSESHRKNISKGKKGNQNAKKKIILG